MAADAAYLAVARFQRPHGLKGEVTVHVLTDAPDDVFVPGRVLTPVDETGRPAGPPFVVERARGYHRRWLLKFEGVDDRTAAERIGPMLWGVEAETLAAPARDELYEHEVAGVAVLAHGGQVGTAERLVEVPGGRILVMRVDGREVLVPFRAPIVTGVDRERREITIDPPDGLLEL